MASTLEMAVQDRIQTQKKLDVAEKDFKQKMRELSDLQNVNQKATVEKQQAIKDLGDARQ